MTIRVGINGFGRIGRQSLKAILERAPEVEVVAVNDLVDPEMNALLFKHDSTYGTFPGTVVAEGDELVINGKRIKVLAAKDPAELPGIASGSFLHTCPQRIYVGLRQAHDLDNLDLRETVWPLV